MNDQISRKCLHIHEWPEIDQELWCWTALPGGVLDEDTGRGANWREPTRDLVRKSYGRWLSFLMSTGRLDTSITPADRISRDNVYAYVTCLQEQVKPWTVWSYILRLWCVAKMFTPDDDWEWLYILIAKLNRLCLASRNKRGRMQSPEKIANWAFDRLDELDAGWMRDGMEALAYRNALMVAILVHCPIRLRNLVMIRINRHLKKVQDRYQLDYEPSEVKTNRYLSCVLPLELSPYINNWIQDWRPLLLRDQAIDAFWIGRRGAPIKEGGVYGCVIDTTKAAFGTSINPHLFRDIAATWVVDMAPANVGITSTMLGHVNPKTTEDHYIQANQSVAGARYRKSVDTLRRQLVADYGDPYQDRKHP
jgi:integrase/recombinase XerD